jgi:sulfate permease, SulP family
MKSVASLLSSLFGDWTHEVNVRSLRADTIAGLLGAVLVLPQAIAFAMLAGLPPQYGLYTAIVPCVVAALFGSSRHVMSGPTNALSLALFAMLTPLAIAGSNEYIQLALTVTILVGLIQAAIGLLKLGMLANFISPAVLGGFTSGAAVLIALHAFGDAIGVKATNVSGAIATGNYYLSHLDAIAWASLIVSLSTAASALIVKRFLGSRWPYMLVGLLIGALIGVALNALTTPASWGVVQQVGHIPSAIPQLQLPTVNWDQLPELFGIALALSIVALGQSTSIAKALGLRSGQTIDPNKEFWGQGLSNIAGGFFSSYVSCGSLNRSLPNFEAGAKTPLASVASALILISAVTLFGSALAFLPQAAIAALLLMVAWSLFDLPRWQTLWRQQRTEFLIAAVTASATVLLRMEMAILLGTLLSLVVYLNRTSKPAVRLMGFLSRNPSRHLENIERSEGEAVLTCPQLTMIRMEGAVYFGATAHVSARLADLRRGVNSPKNLLVMTRSMNFVDLSGAELWEQERLARRKIGGDLYFHRPRDEVLGMWQRTGFRERLGPDHIFQTKEQAIATIFAKLDRDICRQCRVRAFKECSSIESPEPQTPTEPSANTNPTTES